MWVCLAKLRKKPTVHMKNESSSTPSQLLSNTFWKHTVLTNSYSYSQSRHCITVPKQCCINLICKNTNIHKNHWKEQGQHTCMFPGLHAVFSKHRHSFFSVSNKSNTSKTSIKNTPCLLRSSSQVNLLCQRVMVWFISEAVELHLLCDSLTLTLLQDVSFFSQSTLVRSPNFLLG